MADIMYMGKPVAGSIPIDDTDTSPYKTMSSQKIDKGLEYRTPYVTQTNGQAVFDNLEPDYEYKICWNSVGADGVDAIDPTSVNPLNVPTCTLISTSAGTNSTTEHPTLKLIFAISGGTDNVSRFYLSYFKGE